MHIENPEATPLPQGFASLSIPESGAGSNGQSSRVNVLLVDDRKDKLLALEAILEPLGQNLVKATSGKQALRLLMKQEFAVILMDVSMPGMDGLETAALIRKRPSLEHTPIIFVTSVGASASQMYQGYSLGAVDYILTPIVAEVLRTKVGVFVELWRKTDHIRNQSRQLREIQEREHRQRLAEAVDRLEAETRRNRFFTLALDMLGITDFQGRLLQVNPAWETALGFSLAELAAQPLASLVCEEDLKPLEQTLNALQREQTIARFEGRFRRKDGSFRWLSWSAAPFPEEQLIYLFGRDITAGKEHEEEIRRLNLALNDRVAALTEVNQELHAFNYSISHDLRAPLRSMAGFAELLLTEVELSLDARGLEYARRILRSAKFMDELLHDLLEYSQVARTEIRLAPVRIEDALNQVLAMREGDLLERSARVEVASPLAPVLAHLPTLQQILSNLIDNSLKFVLPDKPPLLRISTISDANWVRLWIEDNGIGIEPEYHARIFGLFTRLHPAHVFPGTGIGLAIVRRAVERMGGRVGLESAAGSGCRFWVELPPASPPGEGAGSPSVRQSARNGKSAEECASPNRAGGLTQSDGNLFADSTAGEPRSPT